MKNNSISWFNAKPPEPNNWLRQPPTQAEIWMKNILNLGLLHLQLYDSLSSMWQVNQHVSMQNYIKPWVAVSTELFPVNLFYDEPKQFLSWYIYSSVKWLAFHAWAILFPANCLAFDWKQQWAHKALPVPCRMFPSNKNIKRFRVYFVTFLSEEWHRKLEKKRHTC